MTHKRVPSGAPWETQVGYCRAVRSGNFVAVSGTAAVDDDGQVVGVGDAFKQTQYCLEILGRALDACGADVEHVVRTRMFVTDIADWPDIGRAHAEIFGDCPPATSMVEVSRLIHPDMCIEVEADAIIP